jgi:hypothetical protein
MGNISGTSRNASKKPLIFHGGMSCVVGSSTRHAKSVNSIVGTPYTGALAGAIAGASAVLHRNLFRVVGAAEPAGVKRDRIGEAA